MRGTLRWLVMVLLMATTAFPAGSAEEVVEEEVAPPFTDASGGCSGPQVAACVATADATTGQLMASLAPAPHPHVAHCLEEPMFDGCVIKIQGCINTPPPSCPLDPYRRALAEWTQKAAPVVRSAEEHAHELIGTGKIAEAWVATEHVLPFEAESVVYTVSFEADPVRAGPGGMVLRAQQGECQAAQTLSTNSVSWSAITVELTCPDDVPLDAAAVDLSLTLRSACSGHCTGLRVVMVDVLSVTARMTQAS